MKRIVLGALLAGMVLVPVPTTQARRAGQGACPAASTIFAGNAAALVTAGNAFGFKLFDRVFSAASQPNVFLSPVSAALALDILYDGARGTTARDIAAMLGVAGLSRQAILNDASALLQTLQSADPRVQLAVASSVWARARVSFKFKQAFLSDARQYFGARVTSLDFTSP